MEGTSGLWSQQQKLIAIEMELYKKGQVRFFVYRHEAQCTGHIEYFSIVYLSPYILSDTELGRQLRQPHPGQNGVNQCGQYRPRSDK